MEPIIRRPGEGKAVRGPAGGPLVFKARGHDTGGHLTALENEVAPGDGPPLHVHHVTDEAWWIISGSLCFRLGDRHAEAPEGSFVFVPRGTPHCFLNDGDTPARILVLFTPSGMEGFFDAFAATPAGTPAPDAFARASVDMDMTVLGPPLPAARPG